MNWCHASASWLRVGHDKHASERMPRHRTKGSYGSRAAVTMPAGPRTVCPQLRTRRCSAANWRRVPECMARPRGARWRLRSTNVRAATMYSASKWSICSGPSWVSARIRDSLPERPQGPKWHPVSWLRRADRLSISSFHLADLGGEAVDVFVLHSCTQLMLGIS